MLTVEPSIFIGRTALDDGMAIVYISVILFTVCF